MAWKVGQRHKRRGRQTNESWNDNAAPSERHGAQQHTRPVQAASVRGSGSGRVQCIWRHRISPSLDCDGSSLSRAAQPLRMGRSHGVRGHRQQYDNCSSVTVPRAGRAGMGRVKAAKGAFGAPHSDCWPAQQVNDTGNQPDEGRQDFHLLFLLFRYSVFHIFRSADPRAVKKCHCHIWELDFFGINIKSGCIKGINSD